MTALAIIGTYILAAIIGWQISAWWERKGGAR